jgi:hypothetical protein
MSVKKVLFLLNTKFCFLKWFSIFSLPNRLFFMLASVKKSVFFTLKLLFFTLELLFFTLNLTSSVKKKSSSTFFHAGITFFQAEKSPDKQDLDM